VAVFVTVVAVASGSIALMLWGSAVGAMGVAATLWARMAWNGVDVTARFRPARAFAGEPISLVVEVTNRKRLPLPSVRLSIWLPRGLLPADSSEPSTIRGYRRRVSLSGGAVAVFDLPVQALRRGEYRLERIDVELSDPFDLAPLRREILPEADLLVMPEARIAVPVEVLRRLPFGIPARAPRMFEERERFAGVRTYEPGDPLNRIHWRLTGHSGVLQTKLFEPTRSAEVLLALDLSVGEPFWDAIYPDIAEDTIGWASFLARQAIRGGWRVGLVSNTHFTRGRGPLRVPAAAAKGHEASLFAALAKMPNEPTSDMAPVLRETGRRMGNGMTAVVLSPRPGPSLRHEIMVLRRRGADVITVSPLDAGRAWRGA
jgi:uncharacterized protein (DUF58 family)